MLKVTLNTGEEFDVPFTSGSTVTIIPAGQSWSDVASLSIETDPVVEPPVILTENPPPPPATLGSDSGTGSNSTSTITIDNATGVTVSDGSSGSNPIADPAPATVDEAVAQAGDAIDTAVAGTVDDPHTHVAKAIADVDAALAQWPDSVELQDAKTQLADLAADLANDGA